MLLYPYWQPQIQGLEHLPLQGPLLLVANHPTLFDPFLIAAATPRPLEYLVDHRVHKIPVLGPLIALCGGVTVRPERASLPLALELLGQGCALVVFPEAEQTHTLELQPFRSGASVLAVKSGVPVIPLGLSGPERLSTARGAWVVGGRVRMHYGPPLRALPQESPEQFGQRLRLALAAQLTSEPLDPPRKNWSFRLTQLIWVPTTWLIFKLADWLRPNNRR